VIGVLDLKISNLSSVVNALAFLGIEHAVLESGDRIAAMSISFFPVSEHLLRV
jgi:imidazoleglycerol phosphate synthase glutamine amidotransferase subunit HisH